jgi:hypothetical protein
LLDCCSSRNVANSEYVAFATPRPAHCPPKKNKNVIEL